MTIIAKAAGALLGLIFNFVALNFFFNFVQLPGPPQHEATEMFISAMVPTGYFAFVKMCEIVGGVLVAIPRTAPLGLLILGPVVVNIFCFHIFLAKGEGLFPLPLLVAGLSLLLLWAHRRAFAPLIKGGAHL